MQRFRFRFFNASRYEEHVVVLVGCHYEDAKAGAWAVLGEMTGERNPREAWRLTSTEQRPLWQEVPS